MTTLRTVPTSFLIRDQHSADLTRGEIAEIVAELVHRAHSDDDAFEAVSNRCGLCYSCRHGSYDPCSLAPRAWCKAAPQ